MRWARFATILSCLAVAWACASFPDRPPGWGHHPAWEAPLPPVREGSIVDPESLHRGILDNGLATLILEDDRLPLIGLRVTTRRGAGIVAPESAGVASFMAELMERGAGDLDALELAEAIESLGASLSVSAARDSVSVSIHGLSRDLDALLAILADVVRRPRFEETEAAKVRSKMLASLQQAKDDPRRLAGWNLAQLLYPGHPYGAPVEGRPESVRSFSSASAGAFHHQVFNARSAIFSAFGAVDPDDLTRKVADSFGDWPSGELAPVGPPSPPTTPTALQVRVVDVPDRGQAQIALGHEGISRTDPDRIPVALANSALGGGGFISRLMTRVRAQEGLTYGVYSYFSLRRQPGPFVVSTSTRVPEVRRVIDLLLFELERMRTEPPQLEEFRSMQTLATGRFAQSLETSGAIVRSLVELEVAGLPADSLDTYRSRVAAVTLGDVARVVRDRLHPDRVAIVVVGPAAAIEPQLADLGAIEVVAP